MDSDFTMKISISSRQRQALAVVCALFLVVSPISSFLDLSSPIGTAEAGASDNPDIIATIESGGDLAVTHDIVVQDGYAYAAAQDAENLAVIDIRQSASPKIIATVGSEDFGTPSGVDVDGDYAFVVSEENQSLNVVDISTPSSPDIVGGTESLSFNDPDEVVVEGGYAYMGYTEGVAIFDVSDPVNPSHVSNVTDTINNVNHITVRGDWAYVSEHNGPEGEEMTTINVSDPSNPIIGDSATDPIISSATDIAVNGDVAYLGSREGDGVALFDISEPTNVAAISNITSTESLSGAHGIQVDRNLGEIYVAAQYSAAITTVNVSDPTSPEIVDSVQDSTLDGAMSLYFDEGKSYSVSQDGNFSVVNVWELVTGTVQNQHQDPVDNVTVEVMGVNYDHLDPGATLEKATQAEDELREAARRKPDSWDTDFSLESEFQNFSDAEVKYALATTGDVNDDPPFLDKADLKNPKRKFATNQEIVLTAWKPVDGGIDGLRSNFDEYDQQQPGKIDDNTDLVIEQLGSKDDVIGEPEVVETDETAGGGFLDPDSMEYATVQLSPGYYRIYPEGSPEAGYPIQVGSHVEIMNTWFPDIQDAEGEITESAQEVREKLDQGVFERRFVTADSDGKFYASVPRNVKTVGLSAHTASGMELSRTGYPTQEDLRALSTEGYTGSFAVSPAPTITDAPASDVEVQVYELSAAPFEDLMDFFNKSEWKEEFLDNLTSIPDQFQNQLTDFQRQELERIYSEIAGIIGANDNLTDQYLEESDRSSIPDSDDLSIEELREEIRHMQDALASEPVTIPNDPGEITETGDQTVSLEFPFGADLSPEQVTVFAHWSNGTTEVVPLDSEHVHIEERFGGDVVVVDEYPLPADGPARANFEVRVANQDGIGESNKRVTNPSFGGDIPGLNSISLSTMHPGPDERVNISLNPVSDSGYRNLTSLEVFGPDGSTVSSNVTSSKTGVFTTSGEGVYTARATFTNHDGDQFTVPVRVEAADQDIGMPATIRLSESPLGTHAVVGDGFEDGSVEVERGGSEVRAIGQVPSDGDAPSEVRVFTNSLTLPPDTNIEVNVVRGTDQEQVSRVSKVAVHTSRLPENALVYRNSNQPLTDDANTRYGDIERNSNGSVVKTFTDGDGTVEIRTNANPGIIDRTKFWLRTKVSGISIPSPLSLWPAPTDRSTAGTGLAVAGLVAGAVVVTCRREI